MANVTTGTTTIKFGSNLRIGYRVKDSGAPFTYLPHYPTFNELPYTFTLASGAWEVEYTELCPNCSGPKYSAAVRAEITIP